MSFEHAACTTIPLAVDVTNIPCIIVYGPNTFISYRTVTDDEHVTGLAK